MLCKTSQTQNGKYYIIVLIFEIKKKKKVEFIITDSRIMVTSGWGWGWEEIY